MVAAGWGGGARRDNDATCERGWGEAGPGCSGHAHTETGRTRAAHSRSGPGAWLAMLAQRSQHPGTRLPKAASRRLMQCTCVGWVLECGVSTRCYHAQARRAMPTTHPVVLRALHPLINSVQDLHACMQGSREFCAATSELRPAPRCALAFSQAGRRVCACVHTCTPHARMREWEPAIAAGWLAEACCYCCWAAPLGCVPA